MSQFVYTYWSECNVTPNSKWILDRWRDNWASHGFSPVILEPSNARLHPRYAEHVALFRSFPTVNPKDYELCCFTRWLAMAMCGGFMVDADCFCLSLEPFKIDGLRFYDRNRIPCAVSGGPEDFERMLKWFRDFRIDIQHNEGGYPHVSDQSICTEHKEADAMDWVMEFGEDRPQAKMIHFSAGSCAKAGGKRAAIERIFHGL